MVITHHRVVKLTAVILAVAMADQLTKAMVVAWLPDGGLRIIPDLADLVLVYNRGAAFGSLAGVTGARWILSAVTLVALAAAFFLARSSLGRRPAVLLGIGAVAGGALGNLVDRLTIGRVVDFVDLYLGDLHWPAFNLADAAITIGGLVLVWQIMTAKETGRKAAEDRDVERAREPAEG